MLDEKKAEKILEGGKIDLYDIDRDADLMWAVADLWNIEKHLNMSLNNISAKLQKNPNDKKLNLLFEALSELLDNVRKERGKHLKHLYKLKVYGIWCSTKHFLGAMMQFGEVAAKEISMGNLERARECFETSEFCYNAIMFLNALAKKLDEMGDANGNSSEQKGPEIQLQEGNDRRS